MHFPTSKPPFSFRSLNPIHSFYQFSNLILIALTSSLITLTFTLLHCYCTISFSSISTAISFIIYLSLSIAQPDKQKVHLIIVALWKPSALLSTCEVFCHVCWPSPDGTRSRGIRFDSLQPSVPCLLELLCSSWCPGR